MDEATFRSWHALHVRVAREEELSDAERTTYEAGLKQLDEEEQLPGGLEELRRTRAALRAASEENARLAARRDALEAEIKALEKALSERARQLLCIEE